MTESSIGFATVLFITTTKTEKSRKEYETTIQAESNFGDSEGSEGTNYPRSSRVKHPGQSFSLHGYEDQGLEFKNTFSAPYTVSAKHLIKLKGKEKNVSQRENNKSSQRLCLDYGLKEGSERYGDNEVKKLYYYVICLPLLLGNPCTNSSAYSQKKPTLPHSYCRTRSA